MIRIVTVLYILACAFAAYTLADMGVWWAAAVCLIVGGLVAVEGLRK